MSDLIAIIDYGSGNVRSVANAFEAIGKSAIICRDWKNLQKASHIVLPGVGAFAHGMKQLNSLSLVDTLEKIVLHDGRPFLGICVGHQLLADCGYEFGYEKGMGWINGKVEKIDVNHKKLKLPHIGWNSVEISKINPLFLGMDSEPSFYFVHSYHLIPEDSSIISSTCQYGVKVIASIQKDNIFGVQFHPEKSQSEGLLLLKNFSEIN